jgi:hypothetical protein
MRKSREKYILLGKNVIPVYELADGQLITAGDIFDSSQYKLYSNKLDAMYDKLVLDLQAGKPLDNYKSSKYFKQYIERLKKDHPEYII